MTEVRRVGFIGLGAIGKPMAERVRGAGFELHLWNRSREKAESLLAEGATWAETPAALAGRVDAVALCVTDHQAVEQVLFGEHGIASAGRCDSLVADHSTIHPSAAAELAQRFAAHGVLIDAPVSGGIVGAQQGTLSLFAGGDATVLDRIRPVLHSYAAKVTHLGAAGSGQAAKACNQMISFGTAAVLAEALTLASRLGLDVNRFPEAIQGGFADSTVLRRCAPAMLSGEPTGNTLTALKDLEIVSDLARLSSTPLPMVGLMTSLFRQAVLQGHLVGGLSALIHLYGAPRSGAVPGVGEGGS